MAKPKSTIARSISAGLDPFLQQPEGLHKIGDEEPIHHEPLAVLHQHRRSCRWPWPAPGPWPPLRPASSGGGPPRPAASAGPGWKKCSPTSRSGCRIPAASTSRLIVDVLVAMIVSGGTDLLQPGDRRPLDRNVLEHRLDDQLCTGQRLSCRAWLQVGPVPLPPSVAASFPCATRRSSDARIRSVPACRAASCSSHAVTFSPATIKAWAIPAPIVPIPSTPASVMRAAVTDCNSGIMRRLPAGTEDVDLVLRGARGHALAKRLLLGEKSRLERILPRPPGPLRGFSAGRSIRAGRRQILRPGPTRPGWLSDRRVFSLRVRVLRLGRSDLQQSPLAASSSFSRRGKPRRSAPMANARWASIGRPLSSISSAASSPINRGNRWVPPAPGLMPRFTSGMLKRLPSAATRKWQAMASSKAPPSTCPATAASTGLGESSIA